MRKDGGKREGAAVSSFEEEEEQRHVDMREGEGARILTSMGQSLWEDIKILGTLSVSVVCIPVCVHVCSK